MIEKDLECTARSCLVEIEEPAITAFEEQDLMEPISDAIVAIKKAMIKREKKHLTRIWFSAYEE